MIGREEILQNNWERLSTAPPGFERQFSMLQPAYYIRGSLVMTRLYDSMQRMTSGDFVTFQKVETPNNRVCAWTDLYGIDHRLRFDMVNTPGDRLRQINFRGESKYISVGMTLPIASSTGADWEVKALYLPKREKACLALRELSASSALDNTVVTLDERGIVVSNSCSVNYLANEGLEIPIKRWYEGRFDNGELQSRIDECVLPVRHTEGIYPVISNNVHNDPSKISFTI